MSFITRHLKVDVTLESVSSLPTLFLRGGVLDGIPHRKLIRGVFIIQNKDKKRITDFLDRFSAEYYVRVVKLTDEDCKIMGVQIGQFCPKADMSDKNRTFYTI